MAAKTKTMLDDGKREAIARRGFLALAATALLGCALALVGCAAPAAEQPAPAQPSSSAQASAASDDLGRVLVAYYSGSGNTQAVAEQVAADLDADIFEIMPVEPYTEADLNWRDESSRVNAEHEDESLRDVPLVQVTPDGFSDYDTIILGYPIWWGIAAWPVDGFVSGNDFAGKTVIPFCTSTSSGLGQSATLLEQLAGTGTWIEGQRFPSSPTEEEVADWVATL